MDTGIKETQDLNGKVSSMRWAVLQLIPIIKWMLIFTPLIALAELWVTKSISWEGLSYFILALASMIATLLGTKAIQSHAEHRGKQQG